MTENGKLEKSVELIRELSVAFGPSGYENTVRDIIKEKVKGKADEILTDRLGNLICKMSFGTQTENKKKIMVSAHMDEVGFMINRINSEGFAEFGCVGGINPSVLAGRKVVVMSECKKLNGVICSLAIHHKDQEDRGKPTPIEKMHVDFGFETKEQAEEYVKIGDLGTFDSEFYRFGKNGCMIKGKALDDRMGCAAMLEIMEELSQNRPNVSADVYFCFTVREEIGYSGAAAAATFVKPDIAFVLESTAIGDIPDTEPHRRVADVGKGGVISIADRSTIYDRDTVDAVMTVAKERGVKAQIKRYVSGGNDAGHIHKAIDGIRVIAISVPTRYLHSPACVANLDDYVSVCELVKNIMFEIN